MKARKLIAGAAALGLFAGLAGVANADQLVVDGDTDDLTIEKESLSMGEVCQTNGADGYNGGNNQPIDLYVKKSGNASVRFADSSDIVFSVVAAQTHSALTVTLPSPAKVSTPGNWTTTVPDDTLLGPVTANVKLSGVSSYTGSGRTAGFKASGPKSGGGTLEDDDLVTVNATVVTAATAVTMDCVLPTASITNPVTPEPSYPQSSTQNAAYTCDDAGTLASGVSTANCVGVVTKPDTTTVNVASGAALPTAATGTYTLRVTPTDGVGNVGATVSRTYTVVATSTTYTVAFHQPIDGNGVVNKGKYGRVIPVKLTLKANGAALTDGSGGPLSIGASAEPCTAAASDDIEQYSPGSSEHGSSFRWDGEQWVYNLDTSALPSAAAGKCYRIGVIRDGKAIGSFVIQLTK